MSVGQGRTPFRPGAFPPRLEAEPGPHECTTDS